MKNNMRIILLLLMLISVSFSNKIEQKELIIGTKVVPPFAMKNPDGKWEGISIELWEKIAQKLNLKYKYQENNLQGLLDNIAQKKIDIIVAAMSVTKERERFSDFTNSFYITNLSILVPKEEYSIVKTITNKLFSTSTLLVVLGMLIILFMAGFAFWFMEKNTHKNKIVLKGIGSGIWWATTTMTTIGNNDTTPKTTGGKIVAIIWMFISIFLITMLIATATSVLTRTKKDYFISKPEDLAKGQIASIRDSFSDRYLRERRFYPIYYENIQQAIEAVKNKKADAFVYDKCILNYIINKNNLKNVELTESIFQSQNYSFELTENSPLREKINRALLEIIQSPEWEDIKHKYLKYVK